MTQSSFLAMKVNDTNGSRRWWPFRKQAAVVQAQQAAVVQAPPPQQASNNVVEALVGNNAAGNTVRLPGWTHAHVDAKELNAHEGTKELNVVAKELTPKDLTPQLTPKDLTPHVDDVVAPPQLNVPNDAHLTHVVDAKDPNVHDAKELNVHDAKELNVHDVAHAHDAKDLNVHDVAQLIVAPPHAKELTLAHVDDAKDLTHALPLDLSTLKDHVAKQIANTVANTASIAEGKIDKLKDQFSGCSWMSRRSMFAIVVVVVLVSIIFGYIGDKQGVFKHMPAKMSGISSQDGKAQNEQVQGASEQGSGDQGGEGGQGAQGDDGEDAQDNRTKDSAGEGGIGESKSGNKHDENAQSATSIRVPGFLRNSKNTAEKTTQGNLRGFNKGCSGFLQTHFENEDCSGFLKPRADFQP